ncbi:MAG TPA: T9SS type A sorting domain-containing protein, partial [Bacteroidales bacterium]|nr:T9SS type A sorting domain-containing protein [Bacteroidales bacterium]
AVTATTYGVMVNALPVPVITGADSVCNGSTGVAYSTEAGMTGYSWIISAGGSITSGAGTNSVQVSWNIAGPQTISVNYTDGNGCTAVTATTYGVMVNALPVPVITGLASVCNGSADVVYSTEDGMTGYSWIISAGGSITSGAGTDSVLVTWNNAGPQTISVNYTDGNGCTASTATGLAVTVHQIPVADAGPDTIYISTPVQIGDPSTGPGTISWLPAAGLSDPAIAQPLASPPVTTTYTLTVSNYGCIASDDVTVTFGGVSYTISGKTYYTGRAFTGNPVPNQPSYNAAVYNIDNVIVIVKNYSTQNEVARDTSDALGNFQIPGIIDGNYLISYDKYTSDTMQMGNGIDVIDLTILKYFITSDTTVDPSRCFSEKYKKAADVDNNNTINAIDIARLKTKIGSPYDPDMNFPKGNWRTLDTSLTISGNDLNINLKTICYGDYNASSRKYRDSLNNWNGLKSLPSDIISTSDEYAAISDPSYFEIPLRISTKMNEFSAMGLELTYPAGDYRLVSVSMPTAGNKNGAVKINPEWNEILAEDNDLMVTDNDGVIRVIYATTNYFDVEANDEMIRLGFRPLRDVPSGELDFELSGTGVIGNQYGEENDEAYLVMPKIFVNGNNTAAGFDFAGYPNPFSGEATLTYNIPENGTVKIDVYNALGELVSELVNEVQTTGKHTVVFSPEGLSSGIYTVKLDYTGKVRSECLVLKMVH